VFSKDRVFLRNICVDTLHKGDTEDNDDDDDDNNNNNNTNKSLEVIKAIFASSKP
jgi:hypothetical protein